MSRKEPRTIQEIQKNKKSIGFWKLDILKMSKIEKSNKVLKKTKKND